MPDNAKELFLTFDLDWAADFVLEPLLDFLEEKDLPATVFITHETALLPRIRQNKRLELGIHPNYNFLLSGEGKGDCAEDTVERLMRLAPEARSVRAHSLGFSSRIMDIYKAHGLTHNSDIWIPHESGLTLRPFLHPSGLTMVPFMWMDDGHCSRPSPPWDPGAFLDGPGLKVFDFHPIHVYLNSVDLSAYEAARPFHQDAPRLPAFVFPDHNRGVNFFLRSLVDEAVNGGFIFRKLGEAVV